MRTADPVAGIALRAPWSGLSVGAAILSAGGALVGIVDSDRIYGHETPTLVNAAIAQDLVQLLVVAPLILVLARAAVNGSVGARLALSGCLAFTSYNYAIYAFDIHFGPLFLVWVGVLGLSSYACAGGLVTLDLPEVRRRFGDRSHRWVAATLLTLATLFAGLWLSEIVADLAAGRGSTSAAAWHVPTDPVHVLDLAIFLPGVFAAGILLARRRPLGYATASAALVLLGLTCLPILLTPAVATVRGDASAVAVVVPIGIVLVASTSALLASLAGLSPRRRRAAGP